MTKSTQRALREHSESIQRAFREHSESIQRVFREHSESTHRAREQSDFVMPSEPKILRLVFTDFGTLDFRLGLDNLPRM